LDLPDVPPSEYEKCIEYWSLLDNPYGKDNFIHHKTTPHKNIWKQKNKIKDLPASFVLRRDVETSFGSANLELNPNLVRIPLYSKLENGEYETVGSKSDKTNFSGSIKFF
jgi:hypothetical protein